MPANTASHNGVFLGLARNSPPSERTVRLFDGPLFPLGTPELAGLPRPAIVVGALPCERLASAVSAEPDVAYVAVVHDLAELADHAEWVDAVVVEPSHHHEICAAGERALAEKRDSRPRAFVSESTFAWHGQAVELSRLDARILRRLLRAQGAVVGERELANELWGVFMEDPGRAVEAHIYRIRKRLSQVAGVKLETVRRRGFRLVLSVPPEARRGARRSELPGQGAFSGA